MRNVEIGRESAVVCTKTKKPTLGRAGGEMGDEDEVTSQKSTIGRPAGKPAAAPNANNRNRRGHVDAKT
jgi:hypothetical protein